MILSCPGIHTIQRAPSTVWGAQGTLPTLGFPSFRGQVGLGVAAAKTLSVMAPGGRQDGAGAQRSHPCSPSENWDPAPSCFAQGLWASQPRPRALAAAHV